MSNRKVYNARYYQKNREKSIEYNKQYYKDNRDEIIKRTKEYAKVHSKEHYEYTKRWRKNHPKKVKEINKRQKLKRYNLSHKDWLRMWDNQNGRCAICSRPFIEPSDAYVDHNHQSGEIRGLLCMKCNFGLGLFKDNPKLTARLTEYLLRKEKEVE